MTNTERLLKKLEAIKTLIETDEDDRYYITTTNPRTGWEGTANFLNDGKRIRVYEGNGDGSDDKDMTYEEFVRDYQFDTLWY